MAAGILGAWLLCPMGWGQAQQGPPSAAELAAITERGRKLAEYDLAVWHATDAVQMANPRTAQGQRSIARLENGKWAVAFGELNAEKSKFLIHYQALEGAKAQEFTAVPHEPPVEDTRFYLFAARAVEVATADFGATARPYNAAVLPADEGQLYVYLYPAPVKTGTYPLGGDVRYGISADGFRIVEKRPLHQAIIDNARAKGKKVAARFHSHVLSEVPEDTDVLHVLQQDPPLAEVVGTQHFVYRIEADGTIRIQQERKK